jgi:hypothetical protein
LGVGTSAASKGEVSKLQVPHPLFEETLETKYLILDIAPVARRAPQPVGITFASPLLRRAYPWTIPLVCPWPVHLASHIRFHGVPCFVPSW